MSRDELVGLIRGYSNLMAPLNLGCKARTQAELVLMADLALVGDLHPLLTKRAGGATSQDFLRMICERHDSLLWTLLTDTHVKRLK
jgi:hypothetical protein